MCPDCKNLNPKDRKEAKVKGAMYWCKYKKCYLYDVCKCEKYEKDKGRKKDDVKKIKKELVECDNMTFFSGIVILIGLIICYLLMK